MMAYNNDKFDEMNEEKSHSGLKMALDIKILTSMGISLSKTHQRMTSYF
jgi:hypothetical protein